jgi:antitoxin HigA-1
MERAERLENVHPGEVLQEEFLKPHGISQYRLSKSIGVQETRISAIVAGKRAITADTALRLAAFFGTTQQFWLNLQNAYDLEEAQRDPALQQALRCIEPHAQTERPPCESLTS